MPLCCAAAALVIGGSIVIQLFLDAGAADTRESKPESTRPRRGAPNAMGRAMFDVVIAIAMPLIKIRQPTGEEVIVNTASLAFVQANLETDDQIENEVESEDSGS